MKQSLLKRNVVQVLLALLLLVGVGAGFGMTAMGAAYADDDAINLRAAETILGGATIGAATEDTSSVINTTNLLVGDTVIMGTIPDGYVGENTWKVLYVDTSGKKALLLSKYIQQATTFGESGNTTWAGSTAQAWCKTFYSAAFSADEKKLIPGFDVDESGTYSINVNETSFEATNVSLTKGDEVFFLSAKEFGTYLQQNDKAATRKDGTEGNWWLRNKWDSSDALVVSAGGSLNKATVTANGYDARPAF